MHEKKWLAEQFEANRAHLRAVAYRMLGSRAEAEDAVQEAWLRLGRSDTSEVDNLTGWLTTVVARVCLDMLRSRKSRREETSEDDGGEAVASDDDPERDALIADSVGLALLVVLKRLAPAERVAFVLHDMFDLPFEEIAPIVGRSSVAARQLASRARRRVRGTHTMPDADLAPQRDVVNAFLVASRTGDFQGLLAVLDPDVVLRADQAAVPGATATQLRGASTVAKNALAFSGRSRFAQVARVNGTIGIVVAPHGRLSVVLLFMISRGKIIEIDVVVDPERLRRLDLAILDE